MEKNKKKYKNKEVIEIKLEFNITSKSSEKKLNKKEDIILVTATVRLVKIGKVNKSLSRRNDTNSILEVKYNYKEIDKFDAGDLKYIAIIAYKGKYPVVFHKDDYVTYTQISKDIKKLRKKKN